MPKKKKEHKQEQVIIEEHLKKIKVPTLKKKRNKWIDNKVEEKKPIKKEDEPLKQETSSNLEVNTINNGFHETLEDEGNFVAPVIPPTNDLGTNVLETGNNLEGTASEFVSTTTSSNLATTGKSLYGSSNALYSGSASYDTENKTYDTNVSLGRTTFIPTETRSAVFSPFTGSGEDTWSHRIRSDPVNRDDFRTFERQQEQVKQESEEQSQLPFQKKKRKTEIF